MSFFSAGFHPNVQASFSQRKHSPAQAQGFQKMRPLQSNPLSHHYQKKTALTETFPSKNLRVPLKADRFIPMSAAMRDKANADEPVPALQALPKLSSEEQTAIDQIVKELKPFFNPQEKDEAAAFKQLLINATQVQKQAARLNNPKYITYVDRGAPENIKMLNPALKLDQQSRTVGNAVNILRGAWAVMFAISLPYSLLILLHPPSVGLLMGLNGAGSWAARKEKSLNQYKSALNEHRLAALQKTIGSLSAEQQQELQASLKQNLHFLRSLSQQIKTGQNRKLGILHGKGAIQAQIKDLSEWLPLF